ncbi:orotidine 5'-phosphate decarboxylase [Candidatus Uhrbacteria bacterium]|nr:orotidine 5'-phosphate decarboxylase [Candidatus Uhrbacteria bacterium]
MDLEERLIIAADSNPEHESEEIVFRRVLAIARAAADLKVTIKVNALLRARGYQLIDQLHNLGCRVFADLKLMDIPLTLASDGLLLSPHEPEFLTVLTDARESALRGLQERLPRTEVLGVTLLTSISEDECRLLHGDMPQNSVRKRADLALRAGLGGIVCGVPDLTPQLAGRLRSAGRTINVVAVRPSWARVTGDDQRRASTVKEAVVAGADRIIVGRSVIHGAPRDLILRTLDELISALEKESR